MHILYRHRMKGHPVMWIPGLDHAGIATQAVVEKYLYRTKNLTKLDVGKEEFISLIWQWKNEKEYTIKNQLKALGASLDWDREYFTIDKVFYHLKFLILFRVLSITKDIPIKDYKNNINQNNFSLKKNVSEISSISYVSFTDSVLKHWYKTNICLLYLLSYLISL